MTPEVATRLKEITVDPKTVMLAKKVAAAPARPSSALIPGIWRYAITVEMGPNKMAMENTTEVKEEAGAWQITDTTKMPQGVAQSRYGFPMPLGSPAAAASCRCAG